MIQTLFGARPAEAKVDQPELARVPVAVTVPDDEYVKLSKEMKVNSIPLALARLEAILQEETLGVYDYDKVVAYLDEQARRLTRESRKRGEYVNFEWKWKCVLDCQYSYDAVLHISSDTYPEPIPMPVLLTMQRIAKRIPGVEFYVSHIRAFKDPFLAVTVKGAEKLYVIERWDEPSFRG